MAWRRQVISNDDLVHPAYYHQTTPRKWRPIESTRIISRIAPEIDLAYARNNWVGKRLAYWNGESLPSYIYYLGTLPVNVVSEFEVAKFARPYSYRILFADHLGHIKNKLDWENIPGRLNLIVNPQDIIIGIAYK
jgi:hypothetical protein